MFRFLFRFAGLVVIAFKLLFVVYDGTKSIADQTIYISRVGPTWQTSTRTRFRRLSPPSRR